MRQPHLPERSKTMMKLASILILIMCLTVLIGCTTTPSEHVIVIDKDEWIAHIDEGEVAPFAGWLITDNRMVEIYEALNRKYPPTP